MAVERKIYVSMTDTFFFFFCEAKDKINKYIIGCDTIEEALIIKDNALDRGDMKSIKIHKKKPVFDEEKILPSWKDKEDCENWLEKDYFKK